MRDRLLDLAAPLVMPLGCAAAAALAALALARLDAGQLAVAAWLPVALFGAGFAVCLRFNRARLGFALVLVAIEYATLLALLPALAPGTARLVYAALALALPVSFIALVQLPERGDLGSPRDVRWLLIITQIALVGGALLGARETALAVLDWQVAPALAALTPVPVPALIAWLAALATLSGRLMAHPGTQRGALLAAALIVLSVLHAMSSTAVTIALLGGAALVLTIAVLQESWSLAYLDTLTELPGRRALEEAFARESGRFAVAMLDVDHFKKFNDTYGHHVGDEVLRMVAAHLRQVGGGGRPFRYGGEEFAVLFRGTTAEEAWPHLDALRAEIADSTFELRRRDRRRPSEPPAEPPPAATEIAITVSIGVADDGGGRRRAHSVMGLADEALYAAKRGGRNQARVHGKDAA